MPRIITAAVLGFNYIAHEEFLEGALRALEPYNNVLRVHETEHAATLFAWRGRIQPDLVTVLFNPSVLAQRDGPQLTLAELPNLIRSIRHVFQAPILGFTNNRVVRSRSPDWEPLREAGLDLLLPLPFEVAAFENFIAEYVLHWPPQWTSCAFAA